MLSRLRTLFDTFTLLLMAVVAVATLLLMAVVAAVCSASASSLIGIGLTPLLLTLICCALLALVLWLTAWLARRLGFSREDEITIVFCGSKKSMATGVPMAQLLFTGGAIGPALLPLMLFHQIQLMVCAVLAQRYARREESATQLATSGSISPR